MLEGAGGAVVLTFFRVPTNEPFDVRVCYFSSLHSFIESFGQRMNMSNVSRGAATATSQALAICFVIPQIEKRTVV